MKIGNHVIGGGSPAYVIAELSANHNHRFEEAVALVQAAKNAGADAIKLQTYTADTLTIDCDKEFFQIGGGTLWDGRKLYDLYQEAFMPWEWQAKLKAMAEELGMDCFSSPFDETAVDFLEGLNMPAYKIASFELVDLPLISRVAKTGKPIIMSTGMATREEIAEALAAAQGSGVRDVALLKCTSAYPAEYDEMDLRTIPDMAVTFGVPIGLSDHTLGTVVPIAAVALGACIIEKHLTISRSIPGPDSAFSLEPDEFARMVSEVRAAEQALGVANYEVCEKESSSRGFRRSLFAVKDIAAGEVLSSDNVRSIRPGHGLPPKHLPSLIGRKAAVAIERGTPLRWDLFQ